MESLRWILLAAGIVFILVIYLLGRSRRRRNHSIVDALEDNDNNAPDVLPVFSAGNLDDVDEGVGEVRIITGESFAEENEDYASLNMSAENDAAEADTAQAGTESEQYTDNARQSKPAKSRMPSDIIVLYILPKGDQQLIGAEINSSAQAMGLSFGEMNIYHYTVNSRNVFSLANMLEPGSFDAETIHDLRTSGLTVFMQISGEDPLDDLTEMLQRSYQLAGLLNARLCNHKREPLTEQDAENYRVQVNNVVNGNMSELSVET